MVAELKERGGSVDGGARQKMNKGAEVVWGDSEWSWCDVFFEVNDCLKGGKRRGIWGGRERERGGSSGRSINVPPGETHSKVTPETHIKVSVQHKTKQKQGK
jgi:hypothetical protein